MTQKECPKCKTLRATIEDSTERIEELEEILSPGYIVADERYNLRDALSLFASGRHLVTSERTLLQSWGLPV